MAAVRAGRVTVIGHRGAPYDHRENTLASLRAALEAGADAVEIDVRLTADRVPVLLHDPTLERLWGHDRRLSSLTYSQVDEVTAGGVPTLRDALALTAGYPAARALVDLPDPAAARAAVTEVHESGAADRAYYCGGGRSMLAVRAADPAAELALSWSRTAPPRPELLARVRPRWLNYHFGLVTRDLVERAHGDGYLFAAWTTDTLRAARRLGRAGVDAVTTNRVAAVRAAL
ncbi:glycerophosphodiester phosphodiesterase [Streptomyces sp. CB02923]|uniref:glycerophosphodiester phosphodiesterase n=1 Tax=Streptomyces sp. CB02923 TaxID=1718985 RepID=UPI00093DD90F|nr:glycerophosphodiester phosphodiesterase [Streptomyces sp. CB02923]OKI07192.1 glycerophosphodiester phosphodiesterase [Streptomyces sp. CB02923]